MMHRRRYLWFTGLLLVCALAACEGGSGSSGFDVRSENAAIQEALGEQRCVQHESLTICPAAETGATKTPTAPPPASTATATAVPGQPTATPPTGVPTGTATVPSSASNTPGSAGTPTASAVPTFTNSPPSRSPTPSVTPARSATPSATPSATASPGAPQVDIGIDPHLPLLCVAADQNGPCEFVLPFAANGFPASATFRVAVRTVNPSGPWTIGSDALTASSFEAPVALNAPVGSTAGTTVQLAVLVYLHAPVNVPGSVEELIDSGADAAFVTDEFTLQPSP